MFSLHLLIVARSVLIDAVFLLREVHDPRSRAQVPSRVCFLHTRAWHHLPPRLPPAARSLPPGEAGPRFSCEEVTLRPKAAAPTLLSVRGSRLLPSMSRMLHLAMNCSRCRKVTKQEPLIQSASCGSCEASWGNCI